MTALLINASPKRIACASKYFLDLLNIQMAGCKTKQIKLVGSKVYDEIFSHFSGIDALIIALPVYVDGVPSNVLRFMQEAEKHIKENNCRFKLYVISNCGFIEGRQCKNILSNMRSFSDAAGLEWGGGVGIGAGEMLSVLRITPLAALVSFILSMLYNLAKGDFIGGLASYPWIGLMINMLVFLLFSSWLFCAMIKMQWNIRRLKTVQNFYTSIPLMPRFLFAITANGYFIIRSAFFGMGFWDLYRKKI
ncbi:MAG: hypothetical protein FWG94_04980 [Oscillospiraceae bacterium]|nr:hypothetical protein [Oscillospiraceae bacterium]